MKVLVICRPEPATNVAVMARHLSEEAAHLARLRDAGTLLEAYSPGGPGAVLILEVSDMQEAQSAADGLPLKAAGLIETELIGLHPLRYLGASRTRADDAEGEELTARPPPADAIDTLASNRGAMPGAARAQQAATSANGQAGAVRAF